MRGAVHDRGVDDLSLAGHPGLEQRGQQPDDEVRRTAAEVADQVGRELRAVEGLAHPEEGAGHRDVVQVVARGLGQRPVLTPAGHPAVDQPRVDGLALLGADAQPLGDARPHPLDEQVGAPDQLEHGRRRLGLLEVEGDTGAASVEEHRGPAREHLPAGPLHADHVGSEVGQDHARVRPGTDARDLDDLHASQRTGALPQLDCHSGQHGRPGRVDPSGPDFGRITPFGEVAASSDRLRSPCDTRGAPAVTACSRSGSKA